ncbi:MAG TPA: hypothetical protein VIK61_05450 [Acidimicrobiia bacterium]
MSRIGARGEDRGPLRARRRIWMFCAVGLVAIAGSAVISSIPLLRVRSEVDSLRADDLAFQQIADLHTSLADLQIFVEPRLAGLAAASPSDIAHAGALGVAVSADAHAVATTLPAMGLIGTAEDFKSAGAAFKKATAGLGLVASGRQTAVVVAAIAAERVAFARL